MKDFKKVVNPAICRGWTRSGKEIEANAFCEINYKDGKLSIHGVVGPTRGGNCQGGAGQCVDEIRKGKPTDDWSDEMLQKFCKYWDEWHLNDMRPYCEHQKQLGWAEQSGEFVMIRSYTLKSEAISEQRKAERAAIDALKEGKTFTPTKEQAFYASLPYEIKTYDEEICDERLDYYALKKNVAQFDSSIKKERRGWIRYEDSKIGLIGRPCPVCGYKYGHAWKREEVPEGVLQWLSDLPDSKKTPAWV